MAAAGQFNKVVWIKKIYHEQNEYGDQVEMWKRVMKSRAQIINLSASRTSVANETFYTDTKQLVMYDFVPVTEFDRIEIDEKDYRIITVVKQPEWRQQTLNIELINQ